MHGLKENVIIGKLIPAGTGLDQYNNVVLRSESGEETRVTEIKSFMMNLIVRILTIYL